MQSQTISHDWAIYASDSSFRRFLAPLYEGIENGRIPATVTADFIDVDHFLETADVEELFQHLGRFFTDAMFRELETYRSLWALACN